MRIITCFCADAWTLSTTQAYLALYTLCSWLEITTSFHVAKPCHAALRHLSTTKTTQVDRVAMVGYLKQHLMSDQRIERSINVSSSKWDKYDYLLQFLSDLSNISNESYQNSTPLRESLTSTSYSSSSLLSCFSHPQFAYTPSYPVSAMVLALMSSEADYHCVRRHALWTHSQAVLRWVQ